MNFKYENILLIRDHLQITSYFRGEGLKNLLTNCCLLTNCPNKRHFSYIENLWQGREDVEKLDFRAWRNLYKIPKDEWDFRILWNKEVQIIPRFI